MIEFKYNVDLSKLNVVKNESDIKDFFLDGHPLFLIPDFFRGAADIWVTYLDFLEKKYDCEIWNQDGGEIISHKIFYNGLVKCIYQSYAICVNEDDDPVDHVIEIEGYIIQDTYKYFLATNVIVFDLNKDQ